MRHICTGDSFTFIRISVRPFQVRRGVIQGDIISSIFFILVMEQLFRVHENTNESVTIGNY